MTPSTVRAREATAADLVAAERLMRSVITYDPRWHRDIDDLRGAYLDAPEQALFVAEAEATGEVVGTAVIRRRMPNVEAIARRFVPEVSCELGRVVVHPEWRRRGVALLLVEAARAWAHAYGYQALHLHTEADNAPALALWGLVGEEIPRPDRPAGESVYFEIPIAQPVRTAREGSAPGNAGGQ